MAGIGFVQQNHRGSEMITVRKILSAYKNEFTVFGSIFCAFLALFVGFSITEIQRAEEHRAFIDHGKEAVATITDKFTLDKKTDAGCRGCSVRIITYYFVNYILEDVKVNGYIGFSKEDWQKAKIGDQFKIIYLPEKTSEAFPVFSNQNADWSKISHLPEPSTAYLVSNKLVFDGKIHPSKVIKGCIFLLIDIILLYIALSKINKVRLLLNTGTRVKAKVRSNMYYADKGMPIGICKYEFLTHTGERQQGKIILFYPTNIREGDEIDVMYLPNAPQQNMFLRPQHKKLLGINEY